MCDITAILQLLEENHTRLCRFEAATQQMLTCPTHLLTEFAKQRQGLVEELEGQQRKLEALCSQQPDGEVVLAAAAAHGQAPDPTDPLYEVFAAALENRAVVNRLPESELQAKQRLQLEQEQILKKIRATNQGAAAKASRFYAVGAAGGGTRLGNA